MMGNPEDLRLISEQLSTLDARLRDMESQVFSPREKLYAALTLYVRTDGNDSNNGRSNTAAGAFLTLSKAFSVVANTLDFAGQSVTVQIADGTYNMAAQLVVPPVNGDVVVTGNTGTPANVVLNFTTSNSHGFISARYSPGNWYFRGFTINGTTGVGNAALFPQFQFWFFDNIRFGSNWNYHILAGRGSDIEALGNYSLVNNVAFHWYATFGGKITVQNRTLTLNASMPFSTFAVAEQFGGIVCSGDTFTNGGSATGTRYNVNTNGVINTGGGGATYLPGNAAGTSASGGQYV